MAKDAHICEYARKHGCVVVTNDLDFPQLLAHTRESAPSIVLLRGSRLTPEARGPSLVSALAACATDLESGAVLTIDWTEKLRVRVLPLR